MSQFYKVKKTKDGFTIVDGEDMPFLSIGINHVDESNLHYSHNEAIYREKYGHRAKWILETIPRVKSFGFNTLGWTQDYIGGDWGEALDWFGEPVDLLHSTGWSNEELLSCGMPYMVPLPVMEIQDWNGNPVYHDPKSKAFKEWCEYLARSICVHHKESRNLVGYFFVDIPGWAPHQSGKDFPSLVGLNAEEREDQLYDVAEAYYSTICNAIRAMDPNHLIFGDRYNGNKTIPKSVLSAMKEHVDILSIQYFCDGCDAGREKMIKDLDHWQKICGLPVLIADIGNWTSTKLNPARQSPLSTQAERGDDYVKTLDRLTELPYFVGCHWCGWIENLSRGWGLIDPWDQDYVDAKSWIGPCNNSVKQRHFTNNNRTVENRKK